MGGDAFRGAGQGVLEVPGGMDDAGKLQAFEELPGGFVGDHEGFGGFVWMKCFAGDKALVKKNAEGEDPVDVGDHGGAEPAEKEAAAEEGEELVDIGGLKAKENGAPGEVDPEHEERDQGKGAVPGVGECVADVEAEAPFAELPENGGDKRPEETGSPVDAGVGDELVHGEDEGPGEEEAGDDVEGEKEPVAGDAGGGLVGGSAEDDGGGDTDRTEGEDAPVKHDASGPASRFDGAVDEIEAALDDDHEGDGAVEKDGEGDEAGGGIGDGFPGAFDDGSDECLRGNFRAGVLIIGIRAVGGRGIFGAGDLQLVERELSEEEPFEGGVEGGAAAGGGDGREEQQRENEDGEERKKSLVGKRGGLAESADVGNFIEKDSREKSGARPPGLRVEPAFSLGLLVEVVGKGFRGGSRHAEDYTGRRLIGWGRSRRERPMCR